MEAFDDSSGQWRPASPRGPIFVDASGRRLRRVKLLGLAALGLVAGYAVLLLVAFMGGSNVAAPFLPLPAAPAARDLPSSRAAPASPPAGPRSAGPAAAGAVPAPVTAVRTPVTALQARAATAQATAAASDVPSARPIATSAQQPAAPVATSAPSNTPSVAPTAPGKSGTAPGQATRPSPPPHP